METVIRGFLDGIPAFLAGAFAMFAYMQHSEAKDPGARHQQKRQELFTAYMINVNDRAGIASLKSDARRWVETCQKHLSAEHRSNVRSEWERAHRDTLNIIRLIEARAC